MTDDDIDLAAIALRRLGIEAEIAEIYSNLSEAYDRLLRMIEAPEKGCATAKGLDL